MLVYVIIAIVLVKYICEVDWLTVIKIGIVVYVLWFVLYIILV